MVNLFLIVTPCRSNRRWIMRGKLRDSLILLFLMSGITWLLYQYRSHYFHNLLIMVGALVIYFVYFRIAIDIIHTNFRFLVYEKKGYQRLMPLELLLRMNVSFGISFLIFLWVVISYLTEQQYMFEIEIFSLSIALLFVNFAVSFDKNQEVFIGKDNIYIGHRRIERDRIESIKKEIAGDKVVTYQILSEGITFYVRFERKGEEVFLGNYGDLMNWS